jgi:hypothetical protein
MPFELFPKADTGSDSGSLFGRRDVSGLDLRKEFSALVYGTPRQLGHGYWVVLRHFDRTQYSEAYNRATGQGKFYQVTGEGVGGPLYPFDDSLIRVMHRDLTVSASRFQVEQAMPGGKALISYRAFYLQHDVDVNEADIIYEISNIKAVGESEPEAVAPPYQRKWDIQEITPYRDRGGRIEYYQVLAGLNPIQSEN